MQDLLLICLSLLSLVLMSLLTVLLVVLMKFMNRATDLPIQLLKAQTIENQKLRNMLLANDVPTLAGLNHTTLPSSETEHLSSDPVEVDLTDLGEAINREEQLAAAGYSTGDLGYDLESAGWPQPVIKSRDGEPTTYDLS